MKIKDQKVKTKKLIKLPLHRILRILLAVLFSILAEFLIISYYTNSKKLEVQYEADVISHNVISAVNSAFDSSLTLTQIISNLYLEYEDTIYEHYDSICRRFIENDVANGTLYLAPDGIITMAYPDSVKESAIGVNLLETPILKENAIKSLESEKLTLGGPYNLFQGGLGFIIRNPIFKDDEFKAFSIVILDTNEFSKQLNKYYQINSENYNFGLWKDNELDIVQDEEGFFYRNTTEPISKKIDIPFSVLNDTWHISIEPKGGWNIGTHVLHQLLLITIIFLIFITLVIYYQFSVEQKIYVLEHDILTGLFTRSAVYRRVRKAFSENPEIDYDVMVLDIKNFKMINSIHGTQKCDELLCYLADYISNDMPDSISGRYGGDIFILYYPTYLNRGKDYFYEKVKQVIENAPIKNIVLKYGYYSRVDKSIPVNMISDRALMAAKSILNNYDYIIANYDGDVSKKHEKVQLYESNFENALKNNEFHVWYQPKYDAKTEKLVGAEALVRWQKSDGTVIPPFEFINLFEEDGLIVNLDLFVFRNVCESIKYWNDRGEQLLSISINVSRTTMHHEGILQKYKDIIKETGIPMNSISLEITESAAYSDKQLITIAKELRDAGFILDMDDFGTGSSSLASLNILPFNSIKIDKSLVDFIGRADGNELLKHTIQLAHFKNMKVIAEGVETKDQLDFLKSLDCDVIQGYYFSKPLTYDDWLNTITKNMQQNII